MACAGTAVHATRTGRRSSAAEGWRCPWARAGRSAALAHGRPALACLHPGQLRAVGGVAGAATCAPPCLPLQVTIEEREEYEQHIKMGTVVYAGAAARSRQAAARLAASRSEQVHAAQRTRVSRFGCGHGTKVCSHLASSLLPGVDYEAILRQAEKEADVVLWDGEQGPGLCRPVPRDRAVLVNSGPAGSAGTACMRFCVTHTHTHTHTHTSDLTAQAATMTHPSSSPTCSSASPTRIEWAMSSASTPATSASGRRGGGHEDLAPGQAALRAECSMRARASLLRTPTPCTLVPLVGCRRMADAIVINKANTAPAGSVEKLKEAASQLNPGAAVSERGGDQQGQPRGRPGQRAAATQHAGCKRRLAKGTGSRPQEAGAAAGQLEPPRGSVSPHQCSPIADRWCVCVCACACHDPAEHRLPMPSINPAVPLGLLPSRPGVCHRQQHCGGCP